ncbi:MAG: class I SAM-dependent methyltransferase, partial [Parcubacteria group bacterium]|nr:class I SAM-dependent methyltransferase [Parcubacteria group bacterium]
MKKLNLGSGAFRKDGYLNVDINPQCNPDIVHDLDFLPYPFKDDAFDLVETNHCLE